MPYLSQNQSVTGQSALPMVNFQLDRATIQQKSDPEFGLQIAQYIQSLTIGGTQGYFWTRNQKWRSNRNYANGRVPMQRFMDALEFNGKVNYLNLNWDCIHIVNKIVSELVGRWMARSEKIQVTATDSLSAKQKQEEYENLEFIVFNRRHIEELQMQSGVQLIPQNDEIPADKEELRLWQSQIQRLPEEILFERGINDVLAANGWFDTLKEKMLHDSAETGFVATYTHMDEEGNIYVEWLKPENCFYSYSDYPDFRDTSERGYQRTRKISELRRMYGREFHPDNPLALSEEDLFNLAKTAKEYQLYDNLTWQFQWNTNYLRPYDEWNVFVMEFELKSTDSQPYTVITTKKNKSTLIKKGAPNKRAENEEVIEDKKVNIYRGVYCQSINKMLEWGLKKNMIRPQDPKEIGNAEFSYSFYMVQNYDMTCLAIPEKIQEPVDQMIIARLKIQQLVAKMRPPGTAINWESVQNIDYGLGAQNKTIDFKKMFDQTGDFYYRETDGEGNRVGVPFTEIPNAGFAPQLQALIQLYQFHYQVLKDELGEDPNLISQALQPRVTEGNVEASQQQAAFATDYFYWAYQRCMEDTAKKISCLLKNSVTYGAKVYRNILKEENVDSRIFNTKIQMLPDSVQIQKFEILLNNAITTNPDLVLYVDPFELMRVAKEDVKLAEVLFRRGQKKMLVTQQQMQQQNLQTTIQGQMESAKMAEKEKRKTKDMEVEGDIKKAQMTSEAQNKTSVLNMASSLYQKSMESGMPIPAELKPLIDAVMQNVALGAVVATEEQKAKVALQMQSAQQAPVQEQQMQEQQTMEPEPQVAA